ncbi:MAG: hypothetical protein EBT93_13150, partial [Alphaproteobacteria bacterium]|nr:hypothetical protein [Alphaproteobacteria bacterium]
MEFGPRRLTECLNAILAHTAFVKDGRIAKGTRLNGDHLERLEAAGIKQLVVAKLEHDELDEDDTASQLAAALMPTNVRLSEAKTGRLNIYARDRGLLRFDRKELRAINLINEGVTLATVQHNQLVEAGDMIATLKIIPYGVPKSVVADVIAYTDHRPILTFHAIRPQSFSLIQTRVPGMKDQIFKTTEETTKARLNQLGCALVDSRIVAHTPDAIIDAIHNTEQYGPDGFLICGASAIADRRDVVPAGIIAAGGKIDHLGMPVDPGNLLMMARVNDKPIVGMPGCARSPRLNGFDWVLHLLLADLPVDDTEIADMAAGYGKALDFTVQLTEQQKQQKALADGIAGTVGDGMTSAFNALIQGSEDFGSSLRRIASGVLIDIANQLLRVFVIQKAINAISSILNPAKAVSGFAPGVGFNPNVFSMPSLLGRAMGGSVRAGQPYLVGERGPELFMPGRS